MLVRSKIGSVKSPKLPPTLHNGDRMSQAEFHRRYEQCPDDVEFELINGTVYMASPQRRPHSAAEIYLSTLLGLYLSETPGVDPTHNPTLILGESSEPQPDFVLRILPEHGGRTTTVDDYLCGPAELLIEVAHSSMAIDLHGKKDDYEQSGVAEYIVVCIPEQRVYWFDLANRRARKLPSDGILRSKMFPGLWIDAAALLQEDIKQLLKTLHQGLKSDEHARFVRRLAAAAKRPASPRKTKDAKGNRR